MGAVGERWLDVGGVRVFCRRSEGEGDPVVLVHGNPTNSAIWTPFLDRLERPAIAPDLPGWGRSARPDPARFDYSMGGLAGFFERLLDALGVGPYGLVVQDWGGLALIAAQRHPERLRRLTVINAVPLLPGYRWHWVARWFWRRRLAGEALNAVFNRPGLRLGLRRAFAGPGPTSEFVDLVWDHLDRGTRRAILRLYRSADPEALAAAGRGLGSLGCPALVVWGGRDPYLPARFGRLYAERLGAELVELPDAGHWPWLDRPDVVDRVVAFMTGNDGPGRSRISASDAPFGQ